MTSGHAWAGTSLPTPIRTVHAPINYVSRSSKINRRWVSPGLDINTGTYEAHTVPIRDARPIQDRFSFDVHGFTLLKHTSAVTDFRDKAQVDAVYRKEAEGVIRDLTGADHCVPLGGLFAAPMPCRAARSSSPLARRMSISHTIALWLVRRAFTRKRSDVRQPRHPSQHRAAFFRLLRLTRHRFKASGTRSSMPLPPAPCPCSARPAGTGTAAANAPRRHSRQAVWR